jgi:hypothetical protein
MEKLYTASFSFIICSKFTLFERCKKAVELKYSSFKFDSRINRSIYHIEKTSKTSNIQNFLIVMSIIEYVRHIRSKLKENLGLVGVFGLNSFDEIKKPSFSKDINIYRILDEFQILR